MKARDSFIRYWMPSIRENHSEAEFAEEVDDLIAAVRAEERAANAALCRTLHAFAPGDPLTEREGNVAEECARAIEARMAPTGSDSADRSTGKET